MEHEEVDARLLTALADWSRIIREIEHDSGGHCLTVVSPSGLGIRIPWPLAMDTPATRRAVRDLTDEVVSLVAVVGIGLISLRSLGRAEEASALLTDTRRCLDIPVARAIRALDELQTSDCTNG